MVNLFSNQTNVYKKQSERLQAVMFECHVHQAVMNMQIIAFDLQNNKQSLPAAFIAATKCLDLLNTLRKRKEKKPLYFMDSYEQKLRSSDWFINLNTYLAIYSLK